VAEQHDQRQFVDGDFDPGGPRGAQPVHQIDGGGGTGKIRGGDDLGHQPGSGRSRGRACSILGVADLVGASRRNLCPMGAALVVVGVSVLIILLITAVFMLERRPRRALGAEAEPSASSKRSIECSRRPRDETPDDQNEREIPDLPSTPQTWWAKWAEQRARRRREVYGPTELGDSLGFGEGPFRF
jgi:hypothetical protein